MADMSQMLFGTLALAIGLIMIFESWSNEIVSMIGIVIVVVSAIFLVRWMIKAVEHAIYSDFNPR